MGLHEALAEKLIIKRSRAMQCLARYTCEGTEQDIKDCLAMCKRYGVSKEQIATAIEHGKNVKAGIDYPNWK